MAAPYAAPATMRLSSSPTHQSVSVRCWTRAYFRDGSWPCQNASLGRSESREVGDARGMFRSDYALIAAISG
jgi:hypothetical protein